MMEIKYLYLLIAINACKEALEQPAQEPDYWLGYGLQAYDEKPHDDATYFARAIE
jgi:hypothetical protein